MSSDGQGERHPGVDAKLIAALDRVGAALQVLARRAAGRHGLSPMQMRLLLALDTGAPPPARVTALACELDVAEPTVSDAVGTLRRKDLVGRERDPDDRRRYRLRLTPAGRQVAYELRRWTAPAEIPAARIEARDAERTLESLLTLLAGFEQAGLVEEPRICLTCLQFSPAPSDRPDSPHHCLLFDQPLPRSALRVDCAQHQRRALAMPR